MKIVIMIVLNLLLSSQLLATGPSYAIIQLTPIATHANGEVLFKTFRHADVQGSHSSIGIRFGWLVVSHKGVWDEQVAYISDEGDDDDSYEKMLKQIDDYRNNVINLANPDPVLKRLMTKYGFNVNTPLIYEKHKVLALKPQQSCYLGRCINKVLQQKTIEGYVSTRLFAKTKGYEYDWEGKVTKKPFIYKGVVLLHNRFVDYDDDMKLYGAIFNLTNFDFIMGAEMFETMEIDGIVLLPDIFMANE